MYPRLHSPKNFNAHPGAKFEQYSNRSSYHSGMGGEYEVKMPAGYNPSDDSEDDYNPSSLSKKTKRNDYRKFIKFVFQIFVLYFVLPKNIPKGSNDLYVLHCLSFFIR